MTTWNFDITPFIDPIARVVERVVPRLPGELVIFLLGWLVIQIIQAFFSLTLRAARITKAMQQILQSTLGLLLWIGVVALLMQNLGLNQIAIALSGSLAIVALGISTGASKVVADVLAGLFLARSKDFKIGTRFKIGDVEGRIYSLDSRKVRILEDDGTIDVIPNAMLDAQMWKILPEKGENKK